MQLMNEALWWGALCLPLLGLVYMADCCFCNCNCAETGCCHTCFKNFNDTFYGYVSQGQPSAVCRPEDEIGESCTSQVLTFTFIGYAIDVNGHGYWGWKANAYQCPCGGDMLTFEVRCYPGTTITDPPTDAPSASVGLWITCAGRSDSSEFENCPLCNAGGGCGCNPFVAVFGVGNPIQECLCECQPGCFCASLQIIVTDEPPDDGPGCTGNCVWKWNGSAWIYQLSLSEPCSTGCSCAPPASDGSYVGQLWTTGCQ